MKSNEGGGSGLRVQNHPTGVPAKIQEPMTIMVKNCDKCPLANWSIDECRHPDQQDVKLSVATVPSNCPLRSRALILDLNVRKKRSEAAR